MKFGEKLQTLRKSRGMSQEQLAERLEVSRQSVSKWELEESVPELDKVIALSEVFGVTTDYLLKDAAEPQPALPAAREPCRKTVGQVQYVCSAGLMAIGLFAAFAEWYEQQADPAIWMGLTFQTAGVVWYFAGKLICRQEAPFFLKLLNWALGLFLPVSMAASFLLERQLCPYPAELPMTALFLALYLGALAAAFFLLRKGEKRRS